MKSTPRPFEWLNAVWNSLRELRDWWRADMWTVSLVAENNRYRAQNATLSEMLRRTESDRRAMRDSVVDHMRREEALHHEISSLKRHLSMAIDERDQARKRKRRKS